MKNKYKIFTLILILVPFSSSLLGQIGIHSTFPFVERDYEHIDTNSRSMADGVKMISYYLNKSDYEINENPPDAVKTILNDSICVEYGITYSESYGYTVSSYEDGSIRFTNIQFDNRRTLTYYYENGKIHSLINYKENPENANMYRDGWQFEFDESGKLVSEEFYIEDELIEKK